MGFQYAAPAPIPPIQPAIEPIPPRWGYQTSFWQRRQPAFWLFVVAVALGGLVMLGQQLDMLTAAPTAWFVTLLLLTPYAIPVIAIIYFIDTYEREPLSILAAGLLWGALVATTLALYTNTPLGELIFKIAGPQVAQDWGAALTAPFVEEGFKALGVILLVSIARAELDDLLDGFIWGAMVGMGFLLMEDVFYFMRAYAAAGGSFDGLFQIFIIRIIGAGPYSHFLYTGLIGMGIAYFQTRRGTEPFNRRLAIGGGLAALGVACHFFWNSPILSDLAGSGGIEGFLVYATVKGLPMLIGLVIVLRLVRRRENAWFAALAAMPGVAGAISPSDTHELGGVIRRWSARRAVGQAKGPAGGKLKGLLQRQQINLALAATRATSPADPDLLKQHDLVVGLKAELDALPAFVLAAPTGQVAWPAGSMPGAPGPGPAGPQPAPQWPVAQPAPVAQPVPMAQPAPVTQPAPVAPQPAPVTQPELEPARQPVVQPEPAPAPVSAEPVVQPAPAPVPVAAEPAPQPVAEPVVQPAPAPVPVVAEPAPQPAPAPAPAWVPSCRVPAQGMPAWAGPDGSVAPVATLGAGLPLAVVEGLGAWAHVTASNGWSGWVDGRLLLPL